MLSQINSTALMGLEVYDINIEVDASGGLPSWDIVGLPDAAVKESKERVYWRRFGEVMHYMADYFTFPHNKNFTGNLYEHNKYEKHLKNHLKRYIESGAADRMVILPVNFGSFRELVEYIGNAHERYLLKERNIAEDVQYILRICSQVIHGILQLAAKQFGREDILIPAAC